MDSIYQSLENKIIELKITPKQSIKNETMKILYDFFLNQLKFQIKDYCNYIVDYCKFKNINIFNFEKNKDFNDYIIEYYNVVLVDYYYSLIYKKFRNEINFAIPRLATGEIEL